MNVDAFRFSKEVFFGDFCDSRRTEGSTVSRQPQRSYMPLKSPSLVRDTQGRSVYTNDIGMDALLDILHSHGYNLKSSQDLSRLLQPDDYAAELRVASEVLSYFKIAKQRIADVMPMIYERSFVREFTDKSRKTLLAGLELVGEFGPENCKKYSVDDPVIEERRRKILQQEEILSNALRIISALPPAAYNFSQYSYY
jgi:hypothetical protein